MIGKRNQQQLFLRLSIISLVNIIQQAFSSKPLTMKTRISPCLGVLLMFWSCGTPSATIPSPAVENDSLVIETFKVNPAELENTLSSLTARAGEIYFTCSVSTWDMPDSEKKFGHTASRQYFPEEVVEQANGKTQTWRFVLTNPSVAASHHYAEYENVVQVTFCSLPDAEGIEEEMIYRLLNVNIPSGNAELMSGDNQGEWHVYADPEENPETPEE